MRLVALISGGVESIVVAALASAMCPRWKRHAVFVDYGQAVREQELSASTAIAREYGMNLEVVTIDLPFLASHDLVAGTIVVDPSLVTEFGVGAGKARSHIVPYRNVMFLSIAASYAGQVGASEVWAGFDYRADDPVTAARDKRPEFVDAFNTVVQESGSGPLWVRTPLQGKTKVETITLGAMHEVKWNLSWSCYNDFPKPCGVCARCVERLDAFVKAGVEEGVEYCTRSFIRDQIVT